LVQRVTFDTDSGILGLNPGTKVQLVKNLGAKLHVTDGQNQFDVDPAQVTNDLDVAANVGRIDAQNAAARNAALSAQRQAVQQAIQQQSAADIKNNAGALKSQEIATSIRDLQERYDALTKQEASIQAQIASATDSYYAHHAAIHGTIAGIGTIDLLQSQLDKVLGAEHDIKNQIAALRRNLK
jgi:hypothetical protein